VPFTLHLQRPITCLVFKVAKSAWLHFTHQTETSLFPYINIFSDISRTFSWLTQQNWQSLFFYNHTNIFSGTPSTTTADYVCNATGQQRSESLCISFYLRQWIIQYIRLHNVNSSYTHRTFSDFATIRIFFEIYEFSWTNFYLTRLETYVKFIIVKHICTSIYNFRELQFIFSNFLYLVNFVTVLLL
jgi:hypothetical protein